MIRKFVLAALIVPMIFFLSYGEKANHKEQAASFSKKRNLRSHYKVLSKQEVLKLIRDKGFFDRYWNKSGDFQNQFEAKTINENKVIIDQATGLIWHQSGSHKFLNLEEAQEWIAVLNDKGYAGFKDWRLPTLEEAASLMENKRQKIFFIDSSFDGRQWSIWTGDTYVPPLMWVVTFSGRLDWFDAKVSFNYVRPVRTDK